MDGMKDNWAGVAAFVAFVAAFLMEVENWHHGGLNGTSIALAGLALLTVHIVVGGWKARQGVNSYEP